MSNHVFMQQVKALFDFCVDKTSDQQQDILYKSEYSEDVKHRVISLLNHHDQDDSLLTKSIIETAQHGLGNSFIKAGDTIEQYRLLNPIGEGGQGEVWLAERNDGEFNHKVAFKFIKLSHNQKELQRFQNERELLASLQHANIAGLIGGGKLDDRLYMIMEWIDGIPLIEYIKQESLNLTQSINLFLQICRAVSFAHSKGIIHRDIKPSNILVDKHNIIKLLDFGIAKTVDADATQDHSMMTLAYSSPEQIEGQTPSTASDVYALGLILYELLTNHRAQNHTTESAAEYIRIISSVTPVKPSLVDPVGKPGFSPKKLQGDLDNLVMMAIRKEPERRYKSVETMISDVQNYLQSKPLLASGDSWIYKVGKSFKRNTFAFMLALIVLAFLIGFPVVMYDASIKLKIQSQKATEQAEIANATSEFITTVLKSATPLANKGEDLNIADVMKSAEQKLLAGSVKNPQVEVKLYRVFASIQHSLENNPKSIEHYQKAAEISEQLGDFEGQLSALGQKAVMYFFNNEIENGNEAFRQADEVSIKVTNPVELAWHNLRKSTNEYKKGNYQLALDLAQSALNEMKTQNNNDPEILGRIYNELAIATSEFDIEKSLPLRDEAIKYAVIFHGKMHPRYISRVNNKITNLLALGKNTEAEEALNEALIIAEKLFTKQHPEYTSLLSELSVLWRYQGEFKKSEKARKFALDVVSNFFGNKSFNYAVGLNNLARIYEDMGEFSKAEQMYNESIQIRQELYPNNLIRISSPQKNLARLLVKSGNYQTAHNLIDHVIEVYLQHDKNNLYNYITKAAAIIGDGQDTIQCDLGMNQLQDLIPELNLQPKTNWEPMLAEIWVGELAMKCGHTNLAQKHLNSGLKKSKLIYKPDSMGQKLIAQKASGFLN